MFDTNTVSHLIRQHPAVVRRVVTASMESLCISVITAGELLFGLTKRLDATRLHRAVGEFLRRVDVLQWDLEVAKRYGALRAALERRGEMLAPLDLLIAAHALTAGAVLVTNDKAFGRIGSTLCIEDWTV